MAKMTAEERKWISEWKIKHYLIDRIGLLLMFIVAITYITVTTKPSIVRLFILAGFIFPMMVFCTRFLLLPLDFLLGATTVEGYYASPAGGTGNFLYSGKHQKIYCPMWRFYAKSDPFKPIILKVPIEGTAEEIEQREIPKQRTLYKITYYRFSKTLLSLEEASGAARVTAKPVLNGTEENKNRQAEQTTEEQSMQTKTSKRFPIDSRNVRRLGIFAALGTLATLLITLNRVGSNPKTGFDWFVIAVFPILFALECAAHGFEFFGTAEFTESGVVFRAPFRKERVFLYKDLRSFGVDYSNNKEYCIFFSKEQNGPGGMRIVSTSFPERGFYQYSDDYMALRYSKEAYRALCDNVPTEIKNRMPSPWEERKRLPQNDRSFTVKEPLRESGK